MEISEWQDAPRTSSSKKASDPFLSSAAIGVIGAIVLHGLIMQSVLGTMHSRDLRIKKAENHSTVDATERPSDELVIVNIAPQRRGAQVQLIDSFSQSISKSNLNVQADVDMPMINIPMALNEKEGSDDVGSEHGNVEISRLRGIYSGQIRARIERLWLRPRTPISGDFDKEATDIGESFQCEAQIVQDAGKVQEVLLPRCNGTAVWQQSLVRAIQQASPLPVPPSADAYTSSISLSFVAFPYGTGARDDGYESVSVQPAQASVRKHIR